MRLAHTNFCQMIFMWLVSIVLRRRIREDMGIKINASLEFPWLAFQCELSVNASTYSNLLASSLMAATLLVPVSIVFPDTL